MTRRVETGGGGGRSGLESGLRDELGAKPNRMARWLEERDQVGPVTPIPGRRSHPPKLWGVLSVEGDEVVARVSGWRAVAAMSKGVSIPLSSVVGVAHDPDVRLHVRAKLRRRASRTGVARLGTYHSIDGWSFWSVGLARNAVVVEASGARYRYLVVEVGDPAATVEEIRRKAGLAAAVTAEAPDVGARILPYRKRGLPSS